MTERFDLLVRRVSAMRSRDAIKLSDDRIDVLIVDPIRSDAKRTSTSLRLVFPDTSIVRVLHSDQALRLMRDAGLFTAGPQLPRLIILDLQAVLDGETLLRYIRADTRTREIPVIVFSNGGDTSDVARAYSLGAGAYVVKPSDPFEYQSVVEHIASMWLCWDHGQHDCESCRDGSWYHSRDARQLSSAMPS